MVKDAQQLMSSLKALLPDAPLESISALFKDCPQNIFADLPNDLTPLLLSIDNNQCQWQKLFDEHHVRQQQMKHHDKLKSLEQEAQQLSLLINTLNKTILNNYKNLEDAYNDLKQANNPIIARSQLKHPPLQIMVINEYKTLLASSIAYHEKENACWQLHQQKIQQLQCVEALKAAQTIVSSMALEHVENLLSNAYLLLERNKTYLKELAPFNESIPQILSSQGIAQQIEQLNARHEQLSSNYNVKITNRHSIEPTADTEQAWLTAFNETSDKNQLIIQTETELSNLTSFISPISYINWARNMAAYNKDKSTLERQTNFYKISLEILHIEEEMSKIVQQRISLQNLLFSPQQKSQSDESREPIVASAKILAKKIFDTLNVDELSLPLLFIYLMDAQTQVSQSIDSLLNRIHLLTVLRDINQKIAALRTQYLLLPENDAIELSLEHINQLEQKAPTFAAIILSQEKKQQDCEALLFQFNQVADAIKRQDIVKKEISVLKKCFSKYKSPLTTQEILNDLTQQLQSSHASIIDAIKQLPTALPGKIEASTNTMKHAIRPLTPKSLISIQDASAHLPIVLPCNNDTKAPASINQPLTIPASSPRLELSLNIKASHALTVHEDMLSDNNLSRLSDQSPPDLSNLSINRKKNSLLHVNSGLYRPTAIVTSSLDPDYNKQLTMLDKKIRPLLNKGPQLFNLWYIALFITLKKQVTNEALFHQSHQLLEDILFELQYPLKNHQVLNQYQHLCQNPKTQWQQLTSMKLPITMNHQNNIQLPTSLNHLFIAIDLQQKRLDKKYPREALLFKQAIGRLKTIANASSNHEHDKIIANLNLYLVDPRYQILGKHRGFYRINELLAKICTHLLNILNRKNPSTYQMNRFFRPTRSVKLLHQLATSIPSEERNIMSQQETHRPWQLLQTSSNEIDSISSRNNSAS